MRVAEQRRSDRGIPRGLSDEDATLIAHSLKQFVRGVPQRPVASSSAGDFCRSLIATKTMNPGRLFFGYFLLAKQKKVTSRRATPGLVNASLMGDKCGANRFAQCARIL